MGCKDTAVSGMMIKYKTSLLDVPPCAKQHVAFILAAALIAASEHPIILHAVHESLEQDWLPTSAYLALKPHDCSTASLQDSLPCPNNLHLPVRLPSDRV